MRKLYLWIFLGLFLIVLLNNQFFGRNFLVHGTRRIILSAIYPFQYVLHSFFSSTQAIVVSFFNTSHVYKENAYLKKELARKLAEEKTFNDLILENQRLRANLGFKNTNYRFRMLGAEVIGRSGSNWFETLEIDRGVNDGIAEDMAVITGSGIVGRIFEVSKYTSKVLLIIDPGSAISGIDERSREVGIVVGGAMNPLLMKYVGANADIREGDTIVTSGVSSIFPKGIPLGKVINVSVRDYDLFKQVQVEPAVNFSHLEEVFVVVK